MSISQVVIDVIDTNVIVNGLKFRRGNEFKLLTLMGTGQFDIYLSVPLVLEYTDVFYGSYQISI